MKQNPRREEFEHWFKPAKYPEGIMVCPLCHLPETTGTYEEECHCWDNDNATSARADSHQRKEPRQ